MYLTSVFICAVSVNGKNVESNQSKSERIKRNKNIQSPSITHSFFFTIYNSSIQNFVDLCIFFSL
jgi:hypothetical protein